MDYEKACRLGTLRAAAAAVYLERATGLKVDSVCAVRPLTAGLLPESDNDAWTPVGNGLFVDVAVFDHKDAARKALVLVVDREGTAKASTREFMSVEEALRVADRIALPVSAAKGSRLRELLESKDLAETVRASTLTMDI